MDFLRYFLIMLVPGIISAYIYYSILRCRERRTFVYTALVFDLFIFMINIFGLYYFKGIYTMTSLIDSMNCLSFTRRYAELSIGIGIALAIISGVFTRLIYFGRRPNC